MFNEFFRSEGSCIIITRYLVQKGCTEDEVHGEFVYLLCAVFVVLTYFSIILNMGNKVAIK